MSTARFNTLQNAAGSKSVPVDTVVDGSAKAWVNFNGTGTVAIRRAFNVSSITDNGTGDYTINLTSALLDVDFSVSGTAGNDQTLSNDSGRILGEFGMASRTTTACRVTTAYVFQGIDTTVLIDSSVVSVQIFR